ncbi:hypothetical protein FOA52_013209 [Chlamydomonas sp. UWO 241]|nr:hypothetical protein FOA52_013209 [Chlamydomonas sp. UWO 241]
MVDDAAGLSSEPSSTKAIPNDVHHNPRKRASGPGFSQRDLKLIEEERARPVPTSREEAIIYIHEDRYGPQIVQYGMYAGAAAVGYTYLDGFRHMWAKNNAGWTATFRTRVIMLAPIMAMYACGNGVIPMPFKRHIESLVGRPALSTMDIMSARGALKLKAAEQSGGAATA